MTLAQRRAIKTLLLNIILLAMAAFIFNNSLPPDQVAGHLHQDTDTTFMHGHQEALALEQGYAKWEYQHYVVLKYATSSKLGVTLVGYPFQDWRLHQRH
jgi:hypothetical protein